MSGSNALAVAQKTASTIQNLIQSNLSEISKVVPKHVTPDRLLKVLVSAIAKTPALGECTPASLVNSFKVAAELGLEPGGALGHLYLVPYGQVCTPIIGYRGLIELMRRSGELASIRAVAVHAKDEFTFEEGIEQRITHRPCLDDEPGPLTFAYCVAKLKDGSIQLEVMSRSQIDAIRNRSKASKSGPWVTDYDEMAKKTVVRRAAKYLPLSSERFARAVEVDDGDYIEGEIGRSSSVAITEESATVRAKELVRGKLGKGEPNGATEQPPIPLDTEAPPAEPGAAS